ncbi:hypothetical protein FWD07_02760 [Candidatus Saccharibacteria bacterium]|nr:hypothetical protein [Candidatus Saccharibacteria bacterium]
MPNKLTPEYNLTDSPETKDSPEMIEIRNSAVAELGSEFHDQWRNENFRNEDGTYRPRVKVEVEVEGGSKWKNEADVTGGGSSTTECRHRKHFVCGFA